jgi:hypothetical protein
VVVAAGNLCDANNSGFGHAVTPFLPARDLWTLG